MAGKAYNEKLIAYFKAHEDELCDTCKAGLSAIRFDLDKSPVCGALAKDAPN